MTTQAPLNDGIMVALAKLVDDSQTETRQPSHSDIAFQFDRFNLGRGDPANQGRTVGKEKRVRAVLSWSLANAPKSGESFVAGFVSAIRSLGGFRKSSPNYCGDDAITSLRQEFAAEGWELLPDGILQPRVLESLSGIELTKALKAYAIRARRGVLDSPLLSGTSKDLLEAVAAHVIVEEYGTYPQTSNFPTLLGQAFTILNLSTVNDTKVEGEAAHRRLERASYELACAVNMLRNKEGTGHGRPWVSGVSNAQARFAIETKGSIAELMLEVLGTRKGQ